MDVHQYDVESSIFLDGLKSLNSIEGASRAKTHQLQLEGMRRETPGSIGSTKLIIMPKLTSLSSTIRHRLPEY